MKVIKENFKNRLRLKADELGLHASEVARKLNISRQTVAHWFSGDSVPRPSRMIKLCDLLNVPVAWLKYGDDTNSAQIVSQNTPENAKSGSGSTIAPQRSPQPYPETPEHMGYPGQVVETKGLHAQTERIEKDGVSFTVNIYGEEEQTEWAAKTVREIMRSNDNVTKQALLSNLSVFREKIRKETMFEARIQNLEKELRREKKSQGSSTDPACNADTE